MASSIGGLIEDQFLCPICLDVFSRPVSTPCGHNFCLPCISSYWSTPESCQCPVCKQSYPRRPDLKVNTFISELASHFKSLQLSDAAASDTPQRRAGDGSAVPCDICTDAKEEAVRSCVECLTSYCGIHLEPHYRVAGLKRHTLLEPAAHLEDRVCKEHGRLLTSYCRDDNVLLCDACASSGHVLHKVVPVQEAYVTMKHRLASTEHKVQEAIQRRVDKVQSVKESLRQSKAETEAVIVDSVQELTELVFEIEKNQAELVRLTGEKQKANEEEADGFIRDMEREATTLQESAAELRELSLTEDGLIFLQRYSKVMLLPHTMDLSSFSLNRQPEVQRVHRSVSKWVSQLRALLSQMSSDIERYSTGASASTPGSLRHVQQYEVNVVLDPSTAHPFLTLSTDGKQAQYNPDTQRYFHLLQIPTPGMFTEHLGVLGRKGFAACKFYFEVFVGRKTEFCLGVAVASIPRKRAPARSFASGLWAIWFMKDKFEAFDSPGVPVYSGRAKRIGVYVDYEGGQVSFYDVKAEALIHSFYDCDFTNKLHPYLNPCDNEYGSNWDPMIIVPVRRAD